MKTDLGDQLEQHFITRQVAKEARESNREFKRLDNTIAALLQVFDAAKEEHGSKLFESGCPLCIAVKHAETFVTEYRRNP
jgi:hypothetical protein